MSTGEKSDQLTKKKAQLDYYKSQNLSQLIPPRFLILFGLIAILLVLLNIYPNTIEISGESSKKTAQENSKQDIAYTTAWKNDKRALDKAIQIDTVEAYQSFLDSNPDSAWRRNFAYYRDRAMLRKAQILDTPEAYQQFLDDFPETVWRDNAMYYKEKAYNKKGPPDNKIATNERLDIDYRISFIEAFDVSSLFVNKGADIKIARVYSRAQANIHAGARIGHLTLYNQATSIIDGAESIGYLTLNDQSSAQLLSVDELAWLEVSETSEVHVYGCKTTYKNGTLKGIWDKNGKPFSFQVHTISQGKSPVRPDTLPANVSLPDCTD